MNAFESPTFLHPQPHILYLWCHILHPFMLCILYCSYFLPLLSLNFHTSFLSDWSQFYYTFTFTSEICTFMCLLTLLINHQVLADVHGPGPVLQARTGASVQQGLRTILTHPQLNADSAINLCIRPQLSFLGGRGRVLIIKKNK